MPKNTLDLLFELNKRIQDLEDQIKEMKKITQFNIDKIPLKYRKAFPDENRKVFFELDTFKPQYPKFYKLSNSGIDNIFSEIQMPNDPKQYTKAKERMSAFKALHREDMIKTEASKPYMISATLLKKNKLEETDKTEIPSYSKPDSSEESSTSEEQ